MVKKLKNQKGITLIALVITVIVMLILVVVTIRIATDGELFNYAKRAARETENQIAREQTILNGMVEGQSIEGWVQGKTPPTEEGGLPEYDANNADLFENGVLKANAKYTDKNRTYPAIIPAGFKILEVDGKKSINEGLVITDKRTEDTKGSEFVWIPVDNINDMIMCRVCGPTVTLDQNTLQCPNCKGNTVLAGKLYYNTSTSTFDSANALTWNSSSYREPASLISDVVAKTSGSKKGVLIASLNLPILLAVPPPDEEPYDLTKEKSQATYQGEFNKMAMSVAQNHGFYVGRYEMSLDSNKNAVSVPTASVATSSDADSIQWYGLYDKASTYSNPSSGKTAVTSEMIWGCEYDQIIKFIGENALSSSYVNGKIICRKMAKKNVVFPTFFVYPNYGIIM